MKKTIIILLLVCLNSSVWAQSITRDALGRVLSYTYSNGTVISYSYQANGNRITKSVLTGSALPLELLSFTARKNPDGTISTVIDWQTAQERNTSHFVVERSSNAIDFHPIGIVAAAGNSTERLSYQYFDQAPLLGNNYYRLRMIDIDGSFTYSSIAVIFFQEMSYSIYPIPASDLLMVQFGSLEPRTIELVDMTGRVLFSITGDEGLVKINLTGLANGVYGVAIRTSNAVTTTKIIKQ